MTTRKEIQKEFASYSDRRAKNLIIDIYSDRVVFLTGTSGYMQEFSAVDRLFLISIAGGQQFL